MIAKIKNGQSFARTINYVMGKNKKDKKATLLLSSPGLLCTDSRTIAACLDAASKRGSHNLKNPLKHISIAFHPEDTPRMTDDFMRQVVWDYMQQMGIKDTEFIVFRHHDKEHQHCHLVFSRVNRRSEVISDSHERQKNLRVCKALTIKYGLSLGSPRGVKHQNETPSADLKKIKMRDAIIKAMEQAEDWQEFEALLKEKGISLNFRINNVTKKLMGVTFSQGKYRYSGSKLSRILSLPNLSEKFGELPSLVHENVREFYDEERSELLDHYYWETQKRREIESAYPEFDEFFPSGPSNKQKGKNISQMLDEMGAEFSEAFLPRASEDGASFYFPLHTIILILLQPYAPQISMGGGGSTNLGHWNDDYLKKKKKKKFKFNFKITRIARSPIRRRRR